MMTITVIFIARCYVGFALCNSTIIDYVVKVCCRNKYLRKSNSTDFSACIPQKVSRYDQACIGRYNAMNEFPLSIDSFYSPHFRGNNSN